MCNIYFLENRIMSDDLWYYVDKYRSYLIVRMLVLTIL
jgi:hypothetical protein